MFIFLGPVLVTATICLTIYKLFELFVRRKERIALIDKFSENSVKFFSPLSIPSSMRPCSNNQSWRFIALRFGFLLLGIGIGMLVGYFIADMNIYSNAVVLERAQHRTYINMVKESLPIIYGSSVLLFAGIALLASFLVEQSVLRHGKILGDNNDSE